MFAAYGLDVLDERVSVRRIWVLARRLPPAARAPGEPWSAEAHLLAALVDHVANLTYVTLRAAGAQNPRRPQPIPRPPRDLERAAASRTAPPAVGSGPASGSGSPWSTVAAALAGIPGVRTVSDGGL